MTTRADRPLLGDHLHLIAADSPTIASLGHDIRDRDTPPGAPPYVETFWLPFLGPSLTWLLRRTAAWLDTPDPDPIPTAMLARQLGLGANTGRNSTLANTLDRGERYRLVRIGATGETLRVATHIGDIPQRYLHQLHPSIQALHHAHYTPKPPAPRLATPEQIQAARTSALARP